MLFAATYLVMAGCGFWFLNAAIGRAPKPHFGLAYLRASLGWSSCFMAVDVLIRLMFGVWSMHPALAVVLGLLMAAAMMAII